MNLALFLSASTSLSVVEVGGRLGDQCTVFVAYPVCCSIFDYPLPFLLFLRSLTFIFLVSPVVLFVPVLILHFTPFLFFPPFFSS